jgi:hypothetical protein
MRSHDKILSGAPAKSSILLVCHHDQPCTTMKYSAIEAVITTMTSVRFSGSLIQGRRDLSNILSSFTAGFGMLDRSFPSARFVEEEAPGDEQNWDNRLA